DPQVRLAACGELAGFADEPAVVPRLYLRLIDEDEDPEVKLAAVESLIAIGGGAASKTVHAWFYGRPEPTDAWSRAGDWLIEQLGAEQIAMDLDSIARRDQSTRRLILRLARRHDSLPPMAALVERLSQSAPPGP
ncbi:MAG: HEAT repeat domain-containing protein, partial [Planctomycetota bacterium]